MKIGTKIIAAVAGALILLGICFFGAGFALGGYAGLREGWAENDFFGRARNRRHDDSYTVTDYGTSASSSDISVTQEIMVTKGTGGNITLTDTQSHIFEGSVESIDISAGYGQFEIKSGSELKVTVISSEFPLDCYWEDGNLNVVQDVSNGWNHLNSPKAKYVIEIPQELDYLSFDIEAGSAKFSGIAADQLNIQTEAGQITLQEVSAQNATMSVSAGQIKATDLSCGNLIADCEVGQIEIKGVIEESLTADVEAGQILVEIPRPATYSWDISTSVGSAKIDGKNYGGFDRAESGGSGAPYFKLSSELGAVELKFS